MCLFELSRNQKVQSKAQQEIDEHLEKHGEITYEMLNDLKFLECCINETLRIYPILGMLFRITTKDFQIPETNVVLKKGTPVFMSVMGIQRDPQIFENPLEFRPERFIDSNVGNGNSKGLIYMPFGDGPSE